MGYTSDRYVADELIRQVGVFPYFGDRHVCEFFPHYITRKETIAAYKLKRTSIAERKGMLKKAVKRLNGWLKKGIPEEDLKGSRETAADILTARFTGVPFIDVGNVPNIGQIDNLQRGLVVETPVLVDQNGFTPLSMGKLPPSVLAVVEPWVPVYDLTLEAGLTGDRQKALQALRCDPVCAHLNTPKLREMGEKLLRANRVYTDYLR